MRLEPAAKGGWGSPLSKQASNWSRPFLIPAALWSEDGSGISFETFPTKGFLSAPPAERSAVGRSSLVAIFYDVYLTSRCTLTSSRGGKMAAEVEGQSQVSGWRSVCVSVTSLSLSANQEWNV